MSTRVDRGRSRREETNRRSKEHHIDATTMDIGRRDFKERRAGSKEIRQFDSGNSTKPNKPSISRRNEMYGFPLQTDNQDLLIQQNASEDTYDRSMMKGRSNAGNNPRITTLPNEAIITEPGFRKLSIENVSNHRYKDKAPGDHQEYLVHSPISSKDVSRNQKRQGHRKKIQAHREACKTPLLNDGNTERFMYSSSKNSNYTDISEEIQRLREAEKTQTVLAPGEEDIGHHSNSLSPAPQSISHKKLSEHSVGNEPSQPSMFDRFLEYQRLGQNLERKEPFSAHQLGVESVTYGRHQMSTETYKMNQRLNAKVLAEELNEGQKEVTPRSIGAERSPRTVPNPSDGVGKTILFQADAQRDSMKKRRQERLEKELQDLKRHYSSLNIRSEGPRKKKRNSDRKVSKEARRSKKMIQQDGTDAREYPGGMPESPEYIMDDYDGDAVPSAMDRLPNAPTSILTSPHFKPPKDPSRNRRASFITSDSNVGESGDGPLERTPLRYPRSTSGANEKPPIVEKLAFSSLGGHSTPRSHGNRRSISLARASVSSVERPDSSRSDIISRGSLTSARLSLPHIGQGTPLTSGLAPWSPNYGGNQNSARSQHLHHRTDGKIRELIKFKSSEQSERPNSTVSSFTLRHTILNRKKYEQLGNLDSPLTSLYSPSKGGDVMASPSASGPLKRNSVQLAPIEHPQTALDMDREYSELRQKLQVARERLVTASQVQTRKPRADQPMITVKRPKTSAEALQRLVRSSEDALGARTNPETALLNRISELKGNYTNRQKLKKKVEEIKQLRKKESPPIVGTNYVRKNMNIKELIESHVNEEKRQAREKKIQNVLQKKQMIDHNRKHAIEEGYKQREFMHDFKRMQKGIRDWMIFITIGCRLRLMKERFEELQYRKTDEFQIRLARKRKRAILRISKLLGPYIARWREKNFLSKNL